MSFGLTFAAAIGSGLMAGLFFVFSVTVMTALGKLPAPAGIAAMQSINSTILSPLFLTAFMGTVLLCVVIAVIAVLNWSHPASPYLVTGALLYTVGTFLVTVVFNVPLNDALAAAPADSAETASCGRAICRSGPAGTTCARRHPPARWPFLCWGSAFSRAFSSEAGARSQNRYVAVLSSVRPMP
jgi:uncharacterized membrane protein